MNKEKKVSVIIPVYNAGKHFEEALESIINQSFTNIETIVINDGSTDDGYTERIAKKYISKIQYYYKENTGVADTLNYAFKLASGDYIARMDADDIADSERIKKQVQFLEENKDITLCGTQISILKDNKLYDGNYPLSDEEIKAEMIFRNTLCHPSVMFRANRIRGRWYYNRDAAAEDYELWSRMLFTEKFANLNERLLTYRIENKSVTHIKSERITADSTQIARKILKKYWLLDEKKYLDEVININEQSNQMSLDNKLILIKNRYELFMDMINHNEVSKLVSMKKLKALLEKQWYHTMYINNFKKEINRKYDVEWIDDFYNYSFDKLLSDLEKVIKSIKDEIGNKREVSIVVCAAGIRGKKLITSFQNNLRIEISTVVDNMVSNIEIEDDRYSVEKLESITTKNYDYVVITSPKNFTIFHDQLIDLGVQNHKIVSDDFMYLYDNILQDMYQ